MKLKTSQKHKIYGAFKKLDKRIKCKITKKRLSEKKKGQLSYFSGRGVHIIGIDKDTSSLSNFPFSQN